MDGPEPQGGRIDRIGRFLLHDLIEHFPEAVARRPDHVERLAGHVHEVELRRIGGLRERIDLGELLDRIHARLGIAVDEEAAPDGPDAVGRASHDVVTLRTSPL